MEGKDEPATEKANSLEGRWEGGRERGREGRRGEGEREKGKEGRGREGGRESRREGRREGGRGEGECCRSTAEKVTQYHMP